jgi:hypothetical protein
MSDKIVAKSDITADPVQAKFDFSKVNFETGDGLQTRFSSTKEMEEYAHAFNEECTRRGVDCWKISLIKYLSDGLMDIRKNLNVQKSGLVLIFFG